MQIEQIKNKNEFKNLKNKLAEMLSKAFYNDAFYSKIMPNSKKRKQQLFWWMKILLRYSYQYGRIYFEKDLKGTALWVGKEKPFLNDFKLALMGMILYPFKVGLKGTLKMIQITTKWVKVHKTIEQPHYYLMTIGIDPQSQHQGIGLGLMSDILKDADTKKIVCYLETAKKENVHFYKKNGFYVVHEENMNGVYCWIMKRPPC